MGKPDSGTACKKLVRIQWLTLFKDERRDQKDGNP